jgi:anthranilate/para-aminobenzoate synthase component I
MIRVEVKRAVYPASDPYQVFEHLYDRGGPSSCFLLESLAGPEADRKSAMVGLDPLLELSIRETTAVLSGLPSLLSRVCDQLQASGWSMTSSGSTAHTFDLEKQQRLWDFLRGVQSCFEVVDGGKGASYAFGYFGYFGYETVRAVENLRRIIPERPDTPDVLLKIFSTTVQFDLERQSTSVVSTSSDLWQGADQALLKQALTGTPRPVVVPEVPAPSAVHDTTTHASYLAKVDKALKYISIGDIYQVQVGHELMVKSDADPMDVYRRLRWRNPGPYMYLAQLGDVMVIGSSPEVFVRVDAGRLTMRPIAGTAPRKSNSEENEKLVRDLVTDEKERAEHVMLIDLCRNDMARVCKAATVDTNELMVVETYSHVFHLVSNVDGTLKETVDAYDVIAACFPAGTMTGAPKVRAMEIIEELEDTARGLYAGAVGVVDFDGYISTALCIRSATYREGTFRLRASAGIVSHSVAEKEWRETQAKFGALYWAVAGSELVL